MSTEPGASAHLYLFIYANDLLTCAFALNINICLFTYYNRCQQKQVQAPTCICLITQTVCWHVLSLWILISLCLLMRIDVNTNRWMRPPVVVYLCKSVCWNVLSLWILISPCLLMTIYVNTNRSCLSFFRHRFQNWTRNRFQRHLLIV